MYRKEVIEIDVLIFRRVLIVTAMKIGIHQIYYDRSQLPKLDPLFIPYDNTKNENREWAEYHIFEKEFKKKTYTRFDLTGFFSWKYLQKSRISGGRFLQFIRDNPGADVYFINPFPMEELLFQNVWYQGEFYHKGLMAFAQGIMAQLGINLNLKTWVQPPGSFAFCNYWVGSAGFWKGYMEFTGRFAQILRTGLSDEEKEMLHSIASKTNNFSYVAFFMERLFSTYVWFMGTKLNALHFNYNEADLKMRFPGSRFAIFKTLRPDAKTPRILKVFLRKILLVARKKNEL